MTTYYSVANNKDELCLRAADYWLQCYIDTVASKEIFCVALSGGSTPKSLYRLLAGKKYSEKIDWGKVHLFFGDERCVPLDHADSNYLMAKTALIDHIEIPSKNVHAVPYEPDNPARSAGIYQALLSEVLSRGVNAEPRFDLLLLGMGDDGHTASLFPATSILQETKRLVAAVHVPQLDTWRVSLTYPVINDAVKIMVLVSGASKSEKIADIFNSEAVQTNYPIQAIVPKGDLLWLLDTDAAASLEMDRVSTEIRKIA